MVLDDKNLEFHASIHATMPELKKTIFYTWGIPVFEQKLYDYQGPFYEPPLNDSISVRNLQEQSGEAKLLLVLRNTVQTSVQLSVEFPSRKSLVLECHRLCTISSLKNLISQVTGCPAMQLELDDDGRVLRDDMNMFQCLDIFKNRSTINCSLKGE